jgi:predicted dehydrogenase
MAIREVGIIMNGVSGRMGTNQHLVRSLLAIRDQGGLTLPGGDVLMPTLLLLGRNAQKIRALAEKHNIERWSTNLDECLADPFNEIYFDAQSTTLRAESVSRALRAGKHVYCEKPTSTDATTALALASLALEVGVYNGVVQDILFLPVLLKI